MSMDKSNGINRLTFLPPPHRKHVSRVQKIQVRYEENTNG